jgi:hypothetical protein
MAQYAIRADLMDGGSIEETAASKEAAERRCTELTVRPDVVGVKMTLVL